MSDSWIVVETLVPPGPYSVVADGDRTKKWGSLARIGSSRGRSRTAELTRVVTECVRTGESCSEAAILGVPVLGASGAVHAVQVWCPTETGSAVPPPRTVAAWEWDSITGLAHHGVGLERDILAIPEELRRDTRAPTDFFRHVVRFDDRVSYFEFVADLANGGRWDGELTVLGQDGVARRLHTLAKGYTADGSRSVRGLVHDISDAHAPQPLLDSSAVRAVATASGKGVGMVDLQMNLIYEWLSVPLGSLAPWLTEVPEIEPGDRARLDTAYGAVAAGSVCESLAIRVRFADGGWIGVDVELSAFDRELRPQALIQVTPTEQQTA